ncbi:MAG: hypothetical protein K9K75_01055 [Deltaproteobacteria bacterium]|nr:hypothetical protein [Deltaproteobacteria bacterium]
MSKRGLRFCWLILSIFHQSFSDAGGYCLLEAENTPLHRWIMSGLLGMSDNFGNALPMRENQNPQQLILPRGAHGAEAHPHTHQKREQKGHFPFAIESNIFPWQKERHFDFAVTHPAAMG